MPIKVGSVFTGIGGIELGLELAGGGQFETRWQVEVDPFAREVLQRAFPDSVLYGDIRRVDFRRVEAVDVICGGFPCQDVSDAGKRQGLKGERSGLWSEFARAIRDVRPRYVLVENVAALLRRGFGTVLGDLAALGYDAEWEVLRASDVGAPHRRERVFILAHTDRVGRPERRPAVRAREPEPSGRGARVADADGAGLARSRVHAGSRGRAADARGEGAHVGDAARKRRKGAGGVQDAVGRAVPKRHVEAVGDARRVGCEGRGVRGEPRADGIPPWPPGPEDDDAWRHVLEIDPGLEPALCRVAHGLPRRVHRLRALGNAVLPPVAAIPGARILELEAARRGLT